MNKENIVSYLNGIDFDMQNGKFIQAHKTLKFLTEEVDCDVKRGN